MFSTLTTKLALKKVGLPSDFSSSSFTSSSSSSSSSGKKDGSIPGLDDLRDENSSSALPAWPPAWMSVKKLPLTAQAWLTPAPPPVPVAPACPAPGHAAPVDRGRKLKLDVGGVGGGGGGRPVIVLFLRCVGCAFAQKSFLALRALATKNQGRLRCIAVSHSSAAATRKWIDLLGGAWSVEILIDDDRSVYAAWGLGLGSVWYVLNPATQVQGWREKKEGWLGVRVADAVQQQQSTSSSSLTTAPPRRTNTGSGKGGRRGQGAQDDEEDDGEDVGPSTVMGNKWQQAGLFAVDGQGTVVWGAKALRADDVMDLDAAAAALGF
ncbi:hypothetical protein F5X96DRAFT_68886 [Biscogniauxia mediterranea]|nr:hypothetical protein F5X96DRAFT_68886 [Biscogniauxia mediterranea]